MAAGWENDIEALFSVEALAAAKEITRERDTITLEMETWLTVEYRRLLNHWQAEVEVWVLIGEENAFQWWSGITVTDHIREWWAKAEEAVFLRGNIADAEKRNKAQLFMSKVGLTVREPAAVRGDKS